MRNDGFPIGPLFREPGAVMFALWGVPRAEVMLVLRHIHACAFEGDAFELESLTLLMCCVDLQFDLSARAHDAMPRQPVRDLLPQQPRHGAMVKRVACHRGDAAIGTYFARGNGKHSVPEGFIARFIRLHAIQEEASFQLLLSVLLCAGSTRWFFHG